MKKHKIFSSLRNSFFTGLAVALPLFGTCYILYVLFVFTDNLLGRFINSYLENKLGFYIPGLGLVLFILLIFIAGVLAKNILGKSILHAVERSIIKLPLIRQIYPALKQIVNFFFSSKELVFKKAALVEYPRKGLWTMGFVTNEGLPQAKEAAGLDLLNVFIPSTPGPLTGFFIMVPRQEAIILNISIEDALKIIVSGGVLNP